MHFKNSFPSTSEPCQENDHAFVIQSIQKIIKKNLTLFITSIITSIFLGLIIIRYSTPNYKVQSSLLLKDDTKGSDLGETMLWQGLGLALGKSNVDNEIEILKSRTLIESVINDLQLYIHYYATGHVKTTEIYEDSPFQVRLLKSPNHQPKGALPKFEFKKLSKSNYQISDSKNTWHSSFGDTLTLPIGNVIITCTTSPYVQENVYFFKLNSLDEEYKSYKKSLSAATNNKFVSMVQLHFIDILPYKGERILNKHMEAYLRSNMEDKNQIIDSTLIFIDHNIAQVSKELADLETEIETYRTQSQLADLHETSRVLIQNLGDRQTDLANLETQISIIDNLQLHLVNNPEDIVPATFNLEGQNFSSLLQKYNVLQSKLNKLSIAATEAHPEVLSTKSEMDLIRKNLLETIVNRKNNLYTQHLGASKLNHQLSKNLKELPGKERRLLNYGRQQQIKQDLYIILLKKRIETELSKSTNLPNGRIIDNAQSDPIPFSPNKKVVLFMSSIIGIATPFLIIYLQGLFNTKVRDDSEINGLFKNQIIGSFQSQNNDNNNQIARYPIQESFRELRTRLLKKLGNLEQVILITSENPDVDQGYFTHQLADAFTAINKHIIIISAQIPTSQRTETTNTQFHLLKNHADNIIQKTNTITYISIPTSKIEEYNSGKPSTLFDLIESLKQDYDYIFIDSSPVSISSNALIWANHADLTLFIVKYGVTEKNDIYKISEIFSQHEFPKCFLLINKGNTQMNLITTI